MTTKKATILAIDDTQSNLDLLNNLLGEQYNLLVATDSTRGLKLLNRTQVDLILLDVMMPGLDGFETCLQIKANTATQDIPVIFITGQSDEDSIEKGYDVGGMDYVTKPFKLKELRAKIKTQLKLQFLIKDLEYLSFYDQMTGIFNRRKFYDLGERAFQESDGSLFGVMIDIDHFKAINDAHGHPVGDQVIKLVTCTISSLLSDDCIFGRLGGEEFAVLIPSVTEQQATTLADSLRIAIQELCVLTEDQQEVKFTISSGIAQKNLTTQSLDQLLKRADDGLYSAKKGGRNRTIVRT